MEEACDAAAERVGPRKPRKFAYWWQDSAAILRRECIKARRVWQRSKRKQRSRTRINEIGLVYKSKRKELRNEINRLKSLAWQELLDSIDEDPCGLPYKIVLKKLKAPSFGITELLERDLLDQL